MTGGVCVRGNLLCVTWSSARGHVFLFDLQARQPMSDWRLPAAPTGYSDAGGVGIDDHYHLFVADPAAGLVRHYSAFGRHLGDLGHSSPTPQRTVDRTGVLDHPHAVALVGDVLHVACGDRPLRRGVQRLHRDGRTLRPLASQGDPEEPFGAPRGLFGDRDEVLVADTLHGLVQRFRPDGTYVASIACGGHGAVARPIAVARLPHGDVLVVDRGDRPGVHVFGIDGPRRRQLGDLPTHAEAPLALAIDDQGRPYVLDHDGERVVRFHQDLRFDAVIVDLREHLQDHEPRTP